jgi:hypothetical protein
MNSAKGSSVLFHGTRSPARKLATLPSNFKSQLVLAVLQQTQRPILPELFPQLLVFRKKTPLHALLAANLQPRLSVEAPRLCARLQQQSFNTLLRFATLRLLSSLHTPCMAPVTQIHFWVNENQSYLYLNPLSTHSLRTIRLHSLQEFSGSNRETIETHSFFLSDSKLNMKSHTQQ